MKKTLSLLISALLVSSVSAVTASAHGQPAFKESPTWSHSKEPERFVQQASKPLDSVENDKDNTAAAVSSTSCGTTGTTTNSTSATADTPASTTTDSTASASTDPSTATNTDSTTSAAAVATDSSTSSTSTATAPTGCTTTTSATTTSAPNHGHKGFQGLLHALQNVANKPAGAVLANLLLTKYENQLTDEQKAQIQAIQQPDAALSAFADALSQQGSVTEAVDVEKEAIKANSTELENYRKLGDLYRKLGKSGVKLFVNGEELNAEVAPILRDGTTLVPFRAIAEALKASVSWNPDERSVTVTRGNTSIKLFIDSNQAAVNGNPVTLEVAPTILNGNTIVPARFISEALKAIVSWDQQSGSAIINDPTQTGTAPSTTDGTTQSGVDQSSGTTDTAQTATDSTTQTGTTDTTGTTQPATNP